MTPFFASLKVTARKVTAMIGQWGRSADNSVFTSLHSTQNPDPIDTTTHGERYFQMSVNPYIKSGLNYRDISRLFVSAKGLEPDDSGAYFPPQLIYTTPERGNEEQLSALSEQYDELFEGGFGAILKSLHTPAMVYGRAIGEIQWEQTEQGLRSPFIWSRDPQEYILNPPNLAPGVYKKPHIWSTPTSANLIKTTPGKFMVVTFDPLFNNPYGQSLLRALADMTETWNDVYKAWRMGMIKAGYGSWVGEYDVSISGQDSASVAAREQFLEYVQLMANGTASIFDARNKIRAEKLQFDAAAFLNFHESYVQAVSVLMTGSSTALIDGKNGSYAKEESTTTRQKSDKEQADAMLMGAAFTYQFNRFFIQLNYANWDAIPQLQLIRPELIMPTTPQGQDTQDEIEVQTEEVEQDTPEIEDDTDTPLELAEGDLEEDAPLESYTDFPDTRPEPDIYYEVEEAAREYLRNMPSLNYKDVNAGNQADIFTVKRLRTYADALAIQDALLAEIIKTIGLKTEADAWNQYIAAARNIFRNLGITMNLTFEAELIISFRQARQRAYQRGIDALIASEPEGLTGIEFVSRDDKRVRPVHNWWDGVVLAPDDPRVERTRCPADFGCRCNQMPIFNNDKPLTPENEIPDVFPGSTYRGYA